jgi:beta-glucanase (GH16 family)
MPEYYTENNFDPKGGWHEYEIEWVPDYIAWSIDGKEVRRITNAHESVRDIDKELHLFLDFWSPTWDDWGSGFDDSSMPWEARYDWVEAYDWDAQTDSFVLRFRDDFDFYDESRWFSSRGWSFNLNSSLFV